MQGDSTGMHDLPARTPTSRPKGRHRRLSPPSAEGQVPTLVLAVPGRAQASGGSGTPEPADAPVRDVVTQVQAECEHVPVRTGYLNSHGVDSLAAVLGELAGTGMNPSAVVVPLLTGPHVEHDDVLRRTVAASPTRTVVTPALGPHPMLAEALHTRLSDAGLARVQHVRVLSVTIAADGVVIATSGGAKAVRAADVTAVLLASRLAVPVLSAAVPDGTADADVPALADQVDQLREAGARRVVLAPYLVGPEVAPDALGRWARELDVECAAPLGAHPNVARLVAAQYRSLARAR